MLASNILHILQIEYGTVGLSLQVSLFEGQPYLKNQGTNEQNRTYRPTLRDIQWIDCNAANGDSQSQFVLWVCTQTWTYLVNVIAVQGGGKVGAACSFQKHGLELHRYCRDLV